MNPIITKKMSKVQKLVLLNAVAWTLFVTLALGSSLLIDFSKRCFAEFYKTQILPLQKAVERIKGISISFMIVIKDKVDEIGEPDKIADTSPPSIPPETASIQEKRLLPRIVEDLSDKLFPQKKRISKDVSDEDIVIIEAKDRSDDLYGEPYSEGEREDMDITVIEAPSAAEGGKAPSKEISPDKVVTPGKDSPSETEVSVTQGPSVIVVGGGRSISPAGTSTPEPGTTPTDTPPQAAPILLKVREESEVYLELVWKLDGQSDVSKVCIYRRPASGTEFTKIAEEAGSSTSYKDANAADGKIYYYTATAILGTGEETLFSNKIYGISGLSERERVLILVNDQSPGSAEVAEYYRLSRGIPDENVLVLTIPETDEIGASSYASSIETPLQDYLANTRDGNGLLLKDKILFIAATYGVPYRYNDGNISSVDAKLEGIFGEYPEFDTTTRFTTDKGGYIVSRLDGQTAEAAKGIIDRTLYAEKYLDVTTGKAYFDKFGADGESSAVEEAANIAESQMLTVVRLESLYGGADFQIRDCPDAILYYGQQEAYTREVFDWKAGAVGCVMGSSEILDLRTENTGLSGAIADNITAAVGFVKDVQDEDPFSGFIWPFFHGYNFAEASRLASQNANLLRIGDPLYNLARTEITSPPLSGPSIFNIAANMDIANHAIIFNWQTDVPTYGRLDWGANTEYKSSIGEKIILEDGEDVSIERWETYGGDTVENIRDDITGNRFIKLSGGGSHRLRRSDGNNLDYTGDWILGLKLRADTAVPPDEQDFAIVVNCDTTADEYGSYRYLKYTSEEEDSSGNTVVNYLGSAVKDGEWHNILRSLEQDLHEVEPEVDIIKVNYITVIGNLYVDDIVLFKPRGVMAKEHSVALPILSMGLDIYSREPYIFNYRVSAKGPEGGHFLSGDQAFPLRMGSISGEVQTGAIFGGQIIERRIDYSGLEVTFRLRDTDSALHPHIHMDEYLDPLNDGDASKYGVQVILDAGGNYTLDSVLPGIYDLTAKAANSLMGVVTSIRVDEGADLTDVNFGPLLAGDLDGDNDIDEEDEEILKDLIDTDNMLGDLDGDGDVDGYDLNILRPNLGNTGYGGELQIPPEIEPIGDIQADEGEPIIFTVRASDANGDNLTLSGKYLGRELTDGSNSAIEGATFTDNGDGTASFSWTPNWLQGNAAGIGGTQDYYIIFTADDGIFTHQEDVIIGVTDIYNPMEITGFIDEHTVDEEERVQMKVTARGYRGREVRCSLDTSGLELWQQEEIASHALIKKRNFVYGLEENTYYEFMFIWTPGPTAARGDDAVYNITFIFDDDKETDSRTMNINVNDIPFPPEIPLGLSLVREFAYPGEAETSGVAYGNIARYGDYLLITNAESRRYMPGVGEDLPDLKVYNISNQRVPVHVKDYFIFPGEGEIGYWAWTYDMKIHGNMLYLYRSVAEDTDGDGSYDWFSEDDEYYELKILDISDIENGNIVDVAYQRFTGDRMGGYLQNGFIHNGVVVVLEPYYSDPLDYVPDYSILKMVDARDPENITEYNLREDLWGGWEYYYHCLGLMFIESDRLYVSLRDVGYDFIGEAASVIIYDISGLSSGTISEIAAYEREGDINGLYVRENYLYLHVNRYLDDEGLEILQMEEEDGTIFFTPVTAYYINDEPETNINAFKEMLVDDSIIYLGAEGTEIDNSEDGIITLNQENFLLGLDSELLRRNDDLRFWSDTQHFETEFTQPYADIYYDEENMLLYGLRQKTYNLPCAYVDMIRVGLVKEGPDSDLASYKFKWYEDIEIRTVVEDPDGEPDSLNVWVEGLPASFDYEFNAETNILTIRSTTGLPPEGVHDFVIYASDGADEASQAVRIEIIYPDIPIRDVREIQQLINEAQPGATVYIEPGLYTFGFTPRLQQTFSGPLSVVYSFGLMINKNITLEAIDPDPYNTVIYLGDRSISIMDPTYYLGAHLYSPRGFEAVNNVTIEGITVSGTCRGSETIRIWIPGEIIQRGYGYEDTGYWAYFTSSNITSPIYNYSQGLTLRDCNILSKSYWGHSIYTWQPTYDDVLSAYRYSVPDYWQPPQLILDNTTHVGNITSENSRVHDNGFREKITYIWLF